MGLWGMGLYRCVLESPGGSSLGFCGGVGWGGGRSLLRRRSFLFGSLRTSVGPTHLEPSPPQSTRRRHERCEGRDCRSCLDGGCTWGFFTRRHPHKETSGGTPSPCPSPSDLNLLAPSSR